MKRLFLLFAVFLTACSFFEKRDREPLASLPELPETLVAQAKLYCELSYPSYKEKGYVHSRCDGAGFTSLYALACSRFGEQVDLSVFADDTGRPYRDPAHACLADGGSEADYSRDMFLMRLAAAFELRDVAWFERFSAFAEENQWTICRANDAVTMLSRCVVTPGLIRLFYDAWAKARGDSVALHLGDEDQSMDATALPRGTDAHLQMLHVWLAGRVYGALTASELAVAEGQAKREPDNTLFQAIYHLYSDGEQQATYNALALKFPPQNLPNTRDYWCEEYLFQRDSHLGASDNPDWLPCPNDVFTAHSGTDFGLVVYILGKN